MKGRIWLNYFIQSCRYLEDQSKCESEQWAEFMGKVLDVVGQKMNCIVIRNRKKSTPKNHIGVYLDIYAFYFDKADYDLPIGMSDYEDPFSLPNVVVELEKSLDINKITYCAWKILCVRAPIRVLICYQKGKDKILSLVKHLEEIIWQRGLLKDDNGDFFVIIGNDKKGESDWEDFFSIFEWRSERMEKIEGLEL